MRADLIISGRIATLAGSGGFGWVEALAIRAGRVLAGGTWSDVEPLAGAATRQWRLGRDVVVTPSITDAHLHLAAAALAAGQPDLTGLDRAAVCAVIAAAHEQRLAAGDADGWLLGHGWSFAALGEHPDAAWLDEAAPGRPVALVGARPPLPLAERTGRAARRPGGPGGPAVRSHRAGRRRAADGHPVRDRGRARRCRRPAADLRRGRLGHRGLRPHAGGAGCHLRPRSRRPGPGPGAAPGPDPLPRDGRAAAGCHCASRPASARSSSSGAIEIGFRSGRAEVEPVSWQDRAQVGTATAG